MLNLRRGTFLAMVTVCLLAVGAPLTVDATNGVAAAEACAAGTCCWDPDATCYPGDDYPPQDNAYYLEEGPCEDDKPRLQ